MIEGQLASLGANSLVVNSGKRTKSGKTVITGNVKPLTGKDVEAIGTVVGILISKLASALTGLANADIRACDTRGFSVLGFGRNCFRYIPGEKSGTAKSHRGSKI